MLPDRASLIRYARQKLRYAAGGQNLSRLTHGYFVSHSPRIWRPLGINIHSEEDPETNEPISVAHVSGILNSVRPDMRAGGIYGSNSHGGTFQRTTHILAPGAEVDDAHFQHSPQADRDTDLHEDEVHRYVAGQRAVREFVGLNPKQTAYMTPILTSQELANEAARATGGFVHEVQLNPRQFAGNNVTVLNARNGHAALSNSYGLQGALNDSETHLDISRQVHLANTYAGHTRADQTSGNAQALKHLHLINQRHWPMLTQHHDALMTLPGAPHPHQALLGRTLRDHTNLLAPSHEALLSAGEPVSTIYQMALKHPEEPVHRMALADTLDEQGHGGAADFFRSTLPNAEPPPQKLSRRGSIVSYARSRLSSASSSSSLPGHVVAYVAQKLRYAANRYLPRVGEEILVRGNDDIMRRAIYRGINQHNNQPVIDQIAHDGSMIRNVSTEMHRIKPTQSAQQEQQQSWIPSNGERVRFRAANGVIQHAQYGNSYTYEGPHARLSDTHVINSYNANDEWTGRHNVISGDLLHESHDIHPSNLRTPSAGEEWIPERNDRVRVIDARGNSAWATYHSGRYGGHFVVPDGHTEQAFIQNDQLRHSDGVTRAVVTQPEAPQQATGSVRAPTLRLEKILVNGHGYQNGVRMAEALRDAFARIFRRRVNDDVIMKALRVPMTYPGVDPSHPMFADNKIGLNVNISGDSVSAQTKSHDPDYRFEARTRIDSRKIYNNSQKHEGSSDVAGREGKVFSSPHILLNQADAAHELDIPALYVSAAMDSEWKPGGYNGGIVWPAYGYNGRIQHTIHDDAKHRAIDFLQSSKTSASTKDPSDMTLHDLIRAPGGKEFIKHSTDHQNDDGTFKHREYHNAPSGPMFFDTHPTSDSRKILAGETRKVEEHARAAASEGSQAAG